MNFWFFKQMCPRMSAVHAMEAEGEFGVLLAESWVETVHFAVKGLRNV